MQEEGGDPNNRLSKFAKLLRDKGGLFSEALLEAKDGTLLAPSNEAIERADKARLDHVLGSDYLRAEMLGLHFVRDKIISSDYKIRVGGDQVRWAAQFLSVPSIIIQGGPSGRIVGLG